jgi:hypothetical protein
MALAAEERGTGWTRGDGPQLSLSSPTSSNRKAVVRGTPKEHNVAHLRDWHLELFENASYIRGVRRTWCDEDD